VKEEQEEYHPERKQDSVASRLLRAEAVTGKCYVITFSPSHHLTLADMEPSEIVPIIETWTNLYKMHLNPSSPLAEIGKSLSIPPIAQVEITKPQAQYRYMQIFENKGTTMGCSNPHPHGQIWTTTSLPEELTLEFEQLKKYRKEHEGSHLLLDYARLESQEEDRTIFENDSFWAGVPYWAVWPFEVMIVSKQHKRALVDFTNDERARLAEAIAEITRRYDNLFETQFPYSKSKTHLPQALTHFQRHGTTPSSSRRDTRRDRGQSLPHSLLPTAAAQCDCTKVPGGVRNAGGAAARHHSRASCREASGLQRRIVPKETMTGDLK
jgi:UDPglucose--hexose-1-phosphate uridylyltransferase